MALYHGQRPLLDNYPGAAAAYSLRSLSSATLRSPVVRVRRSNDNAEQDFTAFEINNGALVAWVGSGNDGLVTTWYDQSGNDNDATQTTAASQPKIVDAGVLVTEGGKAAIDFDGSDDFFSSSQSLPRYPFSGICVGNGNSGTYFSFYGSSNSRYNSIRPFSIYARQTTASGTHGAKFSYTSSTNNELVSLFLPDEKVSNASAFVNSQSINNTGELSESLVLSNGLVYIGRRRPRFDGPLLGKITEVIVFSSDQSANRVAIETNINNHYGIY